MATFGDVRRLAFGLPEVSESVGRGHLQWRVRDRLFVWERPLLTSERAALGDRAPDGDILGARVADVGVKDALIQHDPSIFFTTPHFEGYPAILARLGVMSESDLVEVITEGWLARAPARLARAFLDSA